MQKSFARSYDSLEPMFGFVEQFFDNENIGRDSRNPVHFAIEELFTNMVRHNPALENDIGLSIECREGVVVVSLTDSNVDAFDVTEDRGADTESPVEDRPIGGLGLHLVRKMVDSLEYDYRDRQSTVTFTRRIEEKDV